MGLKKKVFILFFSLFILFLGISAASFILMKRSKPTPDTNSTTTTTNVTPEMEDDLLLESQNIADKLDVIKKDSRMEIEEFAESAGLYLLDTVEQNAFAVGNLHIGRVSIDLVYTVNEDGLLNRLDGSFTVELEVGDADEVGNLLLLIDNTVMTLFDLDWLEHSVYTSDGASMDPYADDVDEKILRGEASFAISLYDQKQTYWYCRAEVVEGKTFKCSFFRCFDPDVYADESPNVDLREETGVE